MKRAIIAVVASAAVAAPASMAGAIGSADERRITTTTLAGHFAVGEGGVNRYGWIEMLIRTNAAGKPKKVLFASAENLAYRCSGSGFTGEEDFFILEYPQHDFIKIKRDETQTPPRRYFSATLVSDHRQTKFFGEFNKKGTRVTGTVDTTLNAIVPDYGSDSCSNVEGEYKASLRDE
jgi:hypothetical protein